MEAGGQSRQGLVKGEGMGGKLPEDPTGLAALGLFRGCVPDRAVPGHLDGRAQMSAPHSCQLLVCSLASSPSCLSWLEGWDSRAFQGPQKVEAYRFRNHMCLLCR